MPTQSTAWCVFPQSQCHSVTLSIQVRILKNKKQSYLHYLHCRTIYDKIFYIYIYFFFIVVCPETVIFCGDTEAHHRRHTCMMFPLPVTLSSCVHTVSIGDTLRATLRASLSGTLLRTLPDLVTPLKGYSLSPRSCPATRSAPSK